MDDTESIAELQRQLGDGGLTSVELVGRLMQRIEDIDTSGPRIRSVLASNPDAAADAERLDAERSAGRVRGPLHGIPVLVKDNIDTIGALPTTAGSTALVTSAPTTEATVVSRLRAAGTIVLGKTNLSEWANIRSNQSASGWSAVGGLTVNPHALDRSAGGSSSGSGAAVAAGLSPIALGTETDGSILCPAALCGVVGVKPTVGLTSRAGVVPISHTQDTVGPLARSVRDAALVLDVIAGPDPRDPMTAGAPDGGYRDQLDRGAAGLRVGVARPMTWGRHPALDALAEAATAALASAGAVIVGDVELDAPETLGDDEFTVLLHEFKAEVEGYLATRGGHCPTTLAAVIEHNTEDPRELAWFGQDMFERAATTQGLGAPEYLEALARCRRAGREDGIDRVLAEHRLDALIAPAYPPAWKIDLVNGDPGGLYSMSQLPAVAGYPAVTVPIGLVHGLPVGLALFGTAWSEAVLLRLALAVEDGLGPGPAPQFRAPAAG
ncbi:MAG TPA: amidase [Mycobacteriales bacterium]|nr:amidase [Mycobacteriales bacterium]